MNRRGFLAAGAALLAGGFSGEASAGESPREIVATLYRVTLAPKAKVSSFFDAGIRRRYFSKALLAAVLRAEAADKKDGDVTLDFDPITSSQDPDVHDLTIEPEAEGGAKSTVAARFQAYGKPVLVRYDFVKEGSSWKLDDVRGNADGKPWSVRSIFAGA